MKFARQQMMLALGLLCVLLLVTSSFARDAKDERVFDANFVKYGQRASKWRARITS
jgi:hypothetical protein